MVKILVVDDHALLREGLTKILSLEDKFLVVGEAGCGEEAIGQARRLRPDVILMDINMPGINGIEATKIIKKEMPSTGIIALTIHEDEGYIFELIRAGVSGYLLKDIRPDQLIQAINDVAGGKSTLHATVTSKLIGEYSRLSENRTKVLQQSELTPREMEVIKLIAKGMSNRGIARTLYISEKTVKNHITNIFRKLNVEDRTQAALFAIKNKIVEF